MILRLGFWAVVALWVVTTGVILQAPFTGDEWFYYENGYRIGQWLLGTGPSTANLGSHLIDNGWFMPGSSVLLVPISLFGQPSLPVVRLYMSLIGAALALWAARTLWSTFGWRAVAVFLIFPGLSPAWQFMGKTVWGEFPAGLLLMIAACHFYQLLVQAIYHNTLSLKALILFEILLLITIYIRGSFLPFGAAAHVVLLILPLLFAERHRWMGQIWKIPVGVAFFAIAIAPWSLLASDRLGGRVITTSTTTLSIGVTFGDLDKLCFAPCTGDGTIWHQASEFSQTQAQAQGRSELEVQKEMAATALEGVTTVQYLQQVRRNFGRLLLSPNGFSERFLAKHYTLPDSLKSGASQTALLWINRATYYPALVFFVLANLWIARATPRAQLLSLLLKLVTLCVMLQPFLHISHARYWPGFAPFMGLAAFFVLSRWFSAWSTFPSVDPGLRSEPGSAVLTTLQILYVIAALAIAMMIFTA